MRTTNRIYNICNTFRFRWLLRTGFWKMLWRGIAANNGYASITGSCCDRQRVTVGTLSRRQKRSFRIKGYAVTKAGRVLGAPVHLLVKKTDR